MATTHVSGVGISRAQLSHGAQRRSTARQPGGWLLVEAEARDAGHRFAGRLLDTSSGGLGLVLGERLAVGSTVHVSPAETRAEAGEPAWEGREARVVYTSPLPGGRWRIGLAFTAPEPSGLQMWGTRLVLLAALMLALGSVAWTQGASLIASMVVAAIVMVLAAGAEWQHRTELNAYRNAAQPARPAERDLADAA